MICWSQKLTFVLNERQIYPNTYPNPKISQKLQILFNKNKIVRFGVDFEYLGTRIIALTMLSR